MKRENFKQNGRTDSEEDVKINRVNEKTDDGFRFFLFALSDLFSILQKN